MALYSASAEDLDTVVCSFDLQDTKECPKNIQYLVVDLRVSGHPTQSESKKALICSFEVDGKNMSWLGTPFTYYRMC